MIDGLNKEVRFKSSRSSGAGGQHVNKVSTRVELLFEVAASSVLSESEKSLIQLRLKNRISNEGILKLACDETRSQAKNKEIVFERFVGLVEDALKPVKKRKATKPSKSSIEKRLKNKKTQSKKKEARNVNDDD